MNCRTSNDNKKQVERMTKGSDSTNLKTNRIEHPILLFLRACHQVELTLRTVDLLDQSAANLYSLALKVSFIKPGSKKVVYS